MVSEVKSSNSAQFRKKQVIPGHKSKRDVGEKIANAGTTKSYSISMTQPGHKRLRELAHSRHSSISGFIEDIAWGSYIVIDCDAWSGYVRGLSTEAQSHLHQVLDADIAQFENEETVGDP